MNLKIKFRESFRPFAPRVLEERVSDYFELDRHVAVHAARGDPFRRNVELPETTRGTVRDRQLNVPRSDIPAVTHVNYSARVQTINRRTTPDTMT